MRMLVTGAAGFIGSNFVRGILDNPGSKFDSITVLDKLTYAGVEANLFDLSSRPQYNFIQGDICDSSLVLSLVQNVDAVVNFAAESHVDRSIHSAADFVETNARGVQVLLDAIRVSNNSIRFLQVSTDEVYVRFVKDRGMNNVLFFLIHRTQRRKPLENC